MKFTRPQARGLYKGSLSTCSCSTELVVQLPEWWEMAVRGGRHAARRARKRAQAEQRARVAAERGQSGIGKLWGKAKDGVLKLLGRDGKKINKA